MAKRTIPLYCTVINSGALALVRFPSHHVKWRILVRELVRTMKEVQGTRHRDIVTIEGLADDCDANGTEEERKFLKRLEEAFAGNPEILGKFNLYGWNEETQTFSLFRGKSA